MEDHSIRWRYTCFRNRSCKTCQLSMWEDLLFGLMISPDDIVIQRIYLDKVCRETEHSSSTDQLTTDIVLYLRLWEMQRHTLRSSDIHVSLPRHCFERNKQFFFWCVAILDEFSTKCFDLNVWRFSRVSDRYTNVNPRVLSLNWYHLAILIHSIHHYRPHV